MDRTMKRYAIILAAILAISSFTAAQTGSQNVDTVIMASSANYPDAMMASAPANKLGIPVLLTEKDELPESTSNALDDFQPDEVIMLGGPAVISNQVQEQVESRVNTTTRLWGTTQIGTSIEVSSYFWSEGSDEAVIVQYPLDSEKGYSLLSAVKEEVQDEDEPILISKPGTLSAKVLGEVERLGATEVEVYSTRAVNVTQDLEEIGVEDVEVKEGEMERLQERVRNRTLQGEDNRSTLVIVGAANFQQAISVPTSPNSASFVVGSEEQIEEAVELVRDTEAETIKVTGKPSLAQTIADRIENETDRTVDFISGQNASDVAAQVMTQNREEWRKVQQKRMDRWMQEVRNAPGIEKAANKTLERASAQIDSNSSEEAQELLVEAQEAYEEGDYFEARKYATRALSEANVEEYQRLEREEIRERVREEREDFREATKELRELGQKQAEELREAETAEERLDIIQEYREERRETVKELKKEARERQRKDTNDQAEVGSSELKIQVEGTRVGAEMEYTAPTGGYTVAKTVDRGNDSISFVFKLSSPDGPATQVVTDYDARKRIDVQEGDYTVSAELLVDGKTVDTLSGDVTVPGFKEFESQIEKEAEETERESKEENETMETENETTEETGTGSDDSDTTEVIDVTATDYAFSPENIEADKGDSIVFTNKGNATHNVHIPDLDFNKDIEPGETVKLKASKTGKFEVICEFHRPQMTAELEIEG
ncbi:MAG: cupredoxin domain-containing protein [Candidatus Nanohaloarchaea archaeon]